MSKSFNSPSKKKIVWLLAPEKVKKKLIEPLAIGVEIARTLQWKSFQAAAAMKVSRWHWISRPVASCRPDVCCWLKCSPLTRNISATSRGARWPRCERKESLLRFMRIPTLLYTPPHLTYLQFCEWLWISSLPSVCHCTMQILPCATCGFFPVKLEFLRTKFLSRK